MKKTGLLTLLFLLSLRAAMGQVDSVRLNAAPNIIHVDMGILGINANYERTFHSFAKSHLNYRIGLGYVIDFYTWPNANLIGSVQFITGVHYFHFEAGLGLNYMVRDKYEYNFFGDIFRPQLMPLVMIGLRFETPGRGPVIRVGMGTESSVISAGVGWKF